MKYNRSQTSGQEAEFTDELQELPDKSGIIIAPSKIEN